MSFLVLLTLLLIALKLTGVIACSWLLVLLPLLCIPILFLFMCFILGRLSAVFLRH